MSAVTRIARQQAAAAWAALLAMQVMLVVLTKTLSARLRGREADPEAGFTLVEWVIIMVIVAAGAAAAATLIYNHFQDKAKCVTSTDGTNKC
jgi:hypothetical protein